MNIEGAQDRTMDDEEEEDEPEEIEMEEREYNRQFADTGNRSRVTGY